MYTWNLNFGQILAKFIHISGVFVVVIGYSLVTFYRIFFKWMATRTRTQNDHNPIFNEKKWEKNFFQFKNLTTRSAIVSSVNKQKKNTTLSYDWQF